MKILTVHNRYKIRGGEDESRESEDALLVAKGHVVRQLVYDNTQICGANVVGTGLRATWSRSAAKDVRNEINAWRPDILDVHNFFPLASPATHYAGLDCGVPVVQTLHNFRLLCPGATFFRNGRVCEDCLGHRFPIPGVAHGCYHGSSVHTAAVALMISVHRVMKTWEKQVSVFITVSEFAKQKFVEGGFPESKIVVKPNFVANGLPAGCGGSDFLYVGRLAEEKGIKTMIRAMESFDLPAYLNVVGEGPLRSEVETAVARGVRIRYLGRKPQSEVLELMAHSKCVIFPSECYETFGRVAAESFACGTPVIASRIGAIAEIVDHGRTGLSFRPGDWQDLARMMSVACSCPEKLAGMRIEARREYELKYTPERNYSLMMAIYERAIASRADQPDGYGSLATKGSYLWER